MYFDIIKVCDDDLNTLVKGVTWALTIFPFAGTNGLGDHTKQTVRT
jgi:hypothetical protein